MTFLQKEIVDNILEWVREFNEFETRAFWISLIKSKIQDTTLIYKKYNLSNCIINNITNCISYDIYTYNYMYAVLNINTNISFSKFVLNKLLKHNNIILSAEQAVDKIEYEAIGIQWGSNGKFNYKIAV